MTTIDTDKLMHMLVETFIAKNPLLTNRCKKWLMHNPDRLAEFRSNRRHTEDKQLRSLTYHEKYDSDSPYRFPLPPKSPSSRPNTNAEFLETLVSSDAYEKLGESMATMLFETANRSGFMATFMFPGTNHTVPEFSATEYRLAKRIQNKLRRRCYHRRRELPSMRAIVQQLRKQNVKS